MLIELDIYPHAKTEGGAMNTVKGFWQHANGTIYAVKSDTFGKILGGVGPLDLDELRELDDYDYKPAIIGWLEEAVDQHKLHRIDSVSCC